MSGMNNRTDLREALSRLIETMPAEASTAAEDRVLTAFRARSRRSRQVRACWASGAALLVLALGWIWIRPSALPVQKPSGAESTYFAATAGFVALPYAQSGVPLEEAVIVRVNLSPSALGSLGIPVTLSHGNHKISADLLIGQDGIARAVRLVE